MQKIKDFVKKYARLALEILLISGLVAALGLAYWNFAGKKHVVKELAELAEQVEAAQEDTEKVKEALEASEKAMQALEDLLARYANASVFFDNVLGQHLYRVRELERAEQELERIAERLAGREWGSVHDLFSGPVEAGRRPLHPEMSFVAMNSDQGVSVNGLSGTPLHKRLLAQVGGSGEWMDHLTSNVFPVGTETRLIAWPFLPHYAHWLQAGWMRPHA